MHVEPHSDIEGWVQRQNAYGKHLNGSKALTPEAEIEDAHHESVVREALEKVPHRRGAAG